jgi:hypothetical protein
MTSNMPCPHPPESRRRAVECQRTAHPVLRIGPPMSETVLEDPGRVQGHLGSTRPAVRPARAMRFSSASTRTAAHTAPAPHITAGRRIASGWARIASATASSTGTGTRTGEAGRDGHDHVAPSAGLLPSQPAARSDQRPVSTGRSTSGGR